MVKTRDKSKNQKEERVKSTKVAFFSCHPPIFSLLSHPSYYKSSQLPLSLSSKTNLFPNNYLKFCLNYYYHHLVQVLSYQAKDFNFWFKMCGGAIIGLGDLTARNFNRRVSAADFWPTSLSDKLDNFQFEFNHFPQEETRTLKRAQPDSGNFSHVLPLPLIFVLFRFSDWGLYTNRWCTSRKNSKEAEEEPVQRDKAASMGEMGSWDQGSEKRSEGLAGYFQHCWGGRQSLRQRSSQD